MCNAKHISYTHEEFNQLGWDQRLAGFMYRHREINIRKAYTDSH